ncbi:hypothetical protein RB195_016594 [Necator americanus]|uniref:Peptidase family M13 n=1 Tax=Necator americanus TaxID=51031 RepID=A0ABR1C175_NECAM
MGYSERYLPWFTFFVLVCQGISNDLCQNSTAKIQRSFGFDSLADFLNAAVDYSNDPCEDFHQFACGKWLTEGKESVMELVAVQFRDNINKLNAILKAFFLSEEVSSSKSVNAMKEVYKNCLSSDEDWKSDGGPIKFVLARIEKYGYFPLIDGDERETDIDRTHLLAYFNKNKTVVKSILPIIGLDYRDNISQIMISFSPQYDFPYDESNMIIYGNDTFVYPSFDGLLFKVSLKICSEVRANCNETLIRQAVKEMLSVVEKVHRLRLLIAQEDEDEDEDRWYRLSELDVKLSSVNWTKYFIMMAPPDTHSYFLADPLVHVPNRKYIEELDGILQNTPKRVLANFVILHYILSWAKYLNDDYRTLLKEYMFDIGVEDYPSKSTSCVTVTTRMFDAAFTSVYGQKFNGSATEKIVEKLTREIFASFKERIKENKWMTREQKEFAILKAERMKSHVAYEDVHFNETELDNRHKDLIELQHLKFLELVDKYDYSQSISLFRRLLNFNVAEVLVPSLLASEEEFIGPFYEIEFNMVVIPVSFLHMPVFHSEYPVSYSYGSIGSIIAHEIIHGFDIDGIEHDENGNQRTFKRNDWLGYTKGATCLEKQYNNSVIPGTEFKVDGFRTLSENMADVEGVKQSFMAYKSYQKEKGYIEEGRLLTTEDITADQLFFLGWGIILCEKYGEEELENAILVDNHAPSVLRVNNVVSNIEEFADAFRCSPGSPMNPENRCSVF